MCPTVIGRVHTRTAIFVGPAIIGLIFSLVSGHWDWLVLVGVYYMLATFLDTAIYPWLLKWQPPWTGGVLALAEFGLRLVLASILNDKTGGAHNISIAEAAWAFRLLCAGSSPTMTAVLPDASPPSA